MISKFFSKLLSKDDKFCGTVSLLVINEDHSIYEVVLERNDFMRSGLIYVYDFELAAFSGTEQEFVNSKVLDLASKYGIKGDNLTIRRE